MYMFITPYSFRFPLEEMRKLPWRIWNEFMLPAGTYVLLVGSAMGTTSERYRGLLPFQSATFYTAQEYVWVCSLPLERTMTVTI
jgi:hypothetical protein